MPPIHIHIHPVTVRNLLLVWLVLDKLNQLAMSLGFAFHTVT